MATWDDHEAQREGSFAAFFRDNTAPLCRYVKRLVTSQAVAEEITQEAFTRTYAALASDAHPAPRQFLFTTARNLALDHLRHVKTAATDPVGDLDALNPVDETPTAEQALLSKQELALLRAALEELPLRTRIIVTMRCLENQSIATITARLGMSETAVRKYLARGMLHCEDRVGRGSFKKRSGEM
jgi:RNA polymerase sigma-70 factor (ECF subfamily)